MGSADGTLLPYQPPISEIWLKGLNERGLHPRLSGQRIPVAGAEILDQGRFQIPGRLALVAGAPNKSRVSSVAERPLIKWKVADSNKVPGSNFNLYGSP